MIHKNINQILSEQVYQKLIIPYKYIESKEVLFGVPIWCKIALYGVDALRYVQYTAICSRMRSNFFVPRGPASKSNNLEIGSGVYLTLNYHNFLLPLYDTFRI